MKNFVLFHRNTDSQLVQVNLTVSIAIDFMVPMCIVSDCRKKYHYHHIVK